jgi:hypothetical protein
MSQNTHHNSKLEAIKLVSDAMTASPALSKCGSVGEEAADRFRVCTN